MAATDIIFQIGVQGAETAASAVSKVTASFVELGKVVIDEIKEAERFQQVLDRVKVDMSTFGKETKGLIDTFDSFTAANAATIAGLDLTSKEINTLGKAYIDVQRNMGEEAGSFTQFVEQFAKGSSRALKKIGADIEDLAGESATLAQKQRAGIDFVIAKYSEMEIQVETLAEKQFRLNNAIGTLKPQLVGAAYEGFKDWAGASFDSITDLTVQIEKMSDALFATNGLMGEWIASAEGAQFAFSYLGNTIGAALTPFEKFDNNLRVLNQQLDETAVKLMAVNKAGVAFQKSFARHMAEKGALDEWIKQNKQDLAQIKLLEAQFDADNKKKPGKRGPTDEEILLAGFSQKTADEVAAGAAPGELFVDVSGVEDPVVQELNAAMAARAAAAGAEIGIQESKARKLAEINAQIAEDERAAQEVRLGMAEGFAKRTAGQMGKLAGVVDQQSRKGFNAAKALRMSEVAVTTPMAAMEGYRWGLQYGGPFGPVLGAAQAAIATAFGIAQMAMISRQKFRSPSRPTASASASASASAGAFAGGPSSQQGSTVNLTTQVVVDGQVIHDSLMTVVDNKAQQNQETLVKTTS